MRTGRANRGAVPQRGPPLPSAAARRGEGWPPAPLSPPPSRSYKPEPGAAGLTADPPHEDAASPRRIPSSAARRPAVAPGRRRWVSAGGGHRRGSEPLAGRPGESGSGCGARGGFGAASAEGSPLGTGGRWGGGLPAARGLRAADLGRALSAFPEDKGWASPSQERIWLPQVKQRGSGARAFCR